MKSISSFLRDYATGLKTAGEIKSVIEFTTKSHYGGPELVYVVSDHKEPLQVLTGSKTLTDRHINALKALGFSFKQAHSQVRVLD